MRTAGVIFLAVFLFAGIAITPALGSRTIDDGANMTTCISVKIDDLICITIVDCTGIQPIKREIQLPQSEWNELRNKLQTVKKSSASLEESLNAQLKLFKQYCLISHDVTYESLRCHALATRKNIDTQRLMNRITAKPIINNTIFNAMCIINFDLTNGTTGVFGLNTFINLIGFDIISFHHGYAQDGIETKGLFSQKTDPGKYVGAMFGFFGAWIGEKTSLGFYSNVTVAGFTVLTAWLPIPLFP